MDDDQEWLSASQAAEYTGISTTSLRNWHRWGEMRSAPADAVELLGRPFRGEQRGRRGLCFRRADLEELHASWERGRPARERQRKWLDLEAGASRAHDRWEAHAVRCPRRRRCPLAYVALWGWQDLPDPDLNDGQDDTGRRPNLREVFDDVGDVAVAVMCGTGRRLYLAYLDASAAADRARMGRALG